MGRYLGFAVFVWVALSASAAAEEVDPSAMFEAGSAAFADGDFSRAATQFEAAMAAGMPGPAVRYNLGVAYYRLREYGRAEELFRSLASAFPEMQEIADYNLGLSLHQQNRIEEARAAFERARTGQDKAIAALADAMLARSGQTDAGADPDTSASAWVKLFDVALGYDDNVALVEETSLPAGQSTGSPFAEAFGLISVRPGLAEDLRLDASAYIVRYSDAAEFDQDALRLGFAYLWDWHSWRLDAGPYYNYSALAGEGFERRLGASLNARLPFNDSMSLLIRLTHDRVNDLDPSFDFVEGTRDRISIGLEQQRERGRLAVGYVHEQNDRNSASVSPKRHELYAGYDHFLTNDWALEVQGVLRSSDYGELTVPRAEDLSQLSVTATRDFDSGWQLLGQYRMAANSSNVENFAYDRNRFVLGLNRLF